AALRRRFFERLLRLFFGPDEQHPPTLGDRFVKKTTSGFELTEGLAQVDDVNAVPGIEDEFLHLGVPPFGLMSEVDPCFQQFLNANTYHGFFPLVSSSVGN